MNKDIWFIWGIMQPKPCKRGGLFYCRKIYLLFGVAKTKMRIIFVASFTEKAEKMKLYIREEGDMSVGIFPAVWQVDCPFEVDEQDEATLDWFKSEILKLFFEFQETKISAYYEHEKNPDQ